MHRIIEILECICNKCGKVWRPEIQDKLPVICPKCKTQKWDNPELIKEIVSEYPVGNRIVNLEAKGVEQEFLGEETKSVYLPSYCARCGVDNNVQGCFCYEEAEESGGQDIRPNLLEISNFGRLAEKVETDICEHCFVDTFVEDHRSNCKMFSGVVKDR